MLRDDQADARIYQRLLGVEHVERRALARLRLVANAFERARRGVVLADGGFDLRFRRLQLAPGLNDIGLRLVANLFDVEPLLSLAFLV